MPRHKSAHTIPRWSKGLSILSSAFALAVLTAMLFMQGRAFREGWLSYFGLDSIQFPITSSDTYWFALHGWAQIAGGWFENAGRTYVDFLLRFGWLLAIGVFGAFALDWWQQRKQRLAANEAEKKSEPHSKTLPTWLSANGIASWLFRGLISIVIAAVSSAALPAILFFAGAVLVMLIAIAVVPFLATGKEAAEKYCGQSASTAALATLKPASGAPGWGYRIECNTEVCALVRYGRVYVVPVESVERIEIGTVNRGGSKSLGAVQRQICTGPIRMADPPKPIAAHDTGLAERSR